MDTVGVVLVAICFGLVWLFWRHCAVPYMTASRMKRGGYLVALALTSVTLAVFAMGCVAMLMGADQGELRTLVVHGPPAVGLAWAASVGAMTWPRYSLLLRAFRS